MYFVQTRTSVKSWHFTAVCARKGLTKALKEDREGASIFISEVPVSTYVYPVLTLILFATIGVMFAWRG